MSQVMLIVGVDSVDPADSDALDRWYETVHIPEVIAAPGAKTARRYKVVDPETGYPTFLTVYEFVGIDDYRLYETFRDGQKRGAAPPFTAGPPLRVVWRKAFTQAG